VFGLAYFGLGFNTYTLYSYWIAFGPLKIGCCFVDSLFLMKLEHIVIKISILFGFNFDLLANIIIYLLIFVE
jgi:hypothetical protein